VDPRIYKRLVKIKEHRTWREMLEIAAAEIQRREKE
jgi:hypothetical protein